MVEQRVSDRESALVRNKILGRRVRTGGRVADQYVVPGLVAVRLGLVLLIPGIVGLACFVALHDNAAVSISTMANQLSGLEPWTRRIECFTQCDHAGHNGQPCESVRLSTKLPQANFGILQRGDLRLTSLFAIRPVNYPVRDSWLTRA